MEFSREFSHLLLKGRVVVFDFLGANVTAGGENVAVGCDFFQRGRFAEAGFVFINARIFLATPGVVGAGDLGDLLVGQFPVGAVDERSHLAGVDEEGLAVAGAECLAINLAGTLAAREKPQAGGDWRGVEQLPGQGDDAVHQVGLDDGSADFALAGGVGSQRAVGQHEAGRAVGGEVVEEMEDPGIVGVAAVHGVGGAVLALALAARRQGELGVAGGLVEAPPAHVVLDLGVAPVLHVEGRIGEDEVGLEVLEFVVEEGVAPLDVGVNTSDGQVH